MPCDALRRILTASAPLDLLPSASGVYAPATTVWYGGRRCCADGGTIAAIKQAGHNHPSTTV
jgi:hypothetical protein